MPRVRKPGTSNNRTDLATPKVPTGLPYGEAGQLAGAQAAVPVAQPAGQMDWQQLHTLADHHPTGDVVGLDAPTARPDEPITSGLPTGAGPGPDFAMARHDPSAEMQMRLEAFYRRWPTSELLSLLQEARRG